MKKRLFGILIVLAMVACIAPSTAFAVNHERDSWGYWCDTAGYVSVTYVKISETQHKIVCSKHSDGVFGTEVHSGGTATCKAKAVCTKCNAEYGSTNPDNHTGSLEWVTTATTHKQEYTGCHHVKQAEAEHTWENGTCKVCKYSCNHPNGVPTCTETKVCNICGEEYTNPDNHTGSPEWVKTATTHKQEYSCCHSVTVAETNHNWENGKCSKCGYVCQHVGGTATCTEKAVCEICSEEYGETKPDIHSGKEEWIQTAAEHEEKWDCCRKVIIATEVHEWENGVCSECSYVCKHAGGTATCTEKAVCEICGEEYGETKPDIHSGKEVWIQTAAEHEEKWDCCGKVIIAAEVHEWEDGVCSECSYVCKHAGGEATCTEKAVCEICGEKYNIKNGHWYGEWTANGDGTQIAKCRRAGCKHTETTDCQKFDFAVKNGNLVFCPVCGDVENGDRLELIEEAQAEAVTEKLPKGELVARTNDEYLSIAFEYAGKLTTPAGQVKITLPADLVKGKTLTLIAADGTETDLAFEIDSEGEYASFTLDFTDAELPVMLIRLNAEA